MKIKKLLLILLCVPLMFSCGKNNDKTKENTIKGPGDNKKVKNIQNNICGVEADFFLTTEELEYEFNKDIKKAKKKYNNKIIELTACYFNSGSSDDRPHIQILTYSYPYIFMKFLDKQTVNLTKNGMEVKITGWLAIDEYFESLPKCREYSIRTMETGEGVGDITIKGVLQYDDLMETIHFINCCINLM